MNTLDLPPLPIGHTVGCGELNGEKVLTKPEALAYAAAAVLAEREKWKQVGYVMRTGHGTQFAATLNPQHQLLMWNGKPMWLPTFIRAEPKDRGLNSGDLIAAMMRDGAGA